MTPNLLPLYAVAIALIGTLALFARSNKRTGWVKQRSTFVEDLKALQTILDADDSAIPQAAPAKPRHEARPAFAPVAVGSELAAPAFAMQLGQLHAALHQPTVAPARQQQEQEQEDPICVYS